jgi:hypothetical protein
MTGSDRRILRYGPSRAIAGVVALAGAGAAVEADLAGAATGRLLLSCAAGVLVVVAGIDLVFAPRLTATVTGIAVFTPTQRIRLRWSEIDEFKVDEHSHRGLASRTLEIESDGRLIVLSKRSLGRDPRDVYAELLELSELRGDQPAD